MPKREGKLAGGGGGEQDSKRHERDGEDTKQGKERDTK